MFTSRAENGRTFAGAGIGSRRPGGLEPRLGLALLLLLGLGVPFGASAQQAVRPAIEPGQVERRIPPPPALERPPAPLQLPAAPAEAPLSVSSFVLTGVVIDGVTAFDPARLVPLYADELARQIGSAEIDEILRRITTFYRSEGYFLSRAVALPQSLSDGILRITVIEGDLDRFSRD